MVVPAGPRLEAMSPRIAKAAVTRRRLPAVALFPRFAQAGGLLGYGASLPDAFRRAAATVDSLLRGARASDTPAERPQRFEVGVNLKTARGLELTLPSAFLSRADLVVR
jgi:putative ABC transport system substrate-binding protein